MTRFWMMTALALAGCATQQALNQSAATTWLACPDARLREGSVYEGCGKEAVCTTGICRSTVSWQERFSAVSAGFHARFACPVESQQVFEREADYVIRGCDRNATCTLDGACVEFFDLPTQLTRARASFSKETSCPTADVSVVMQAVGFRALGCDRAANCLTFDGPCIAIQLPSCTEIAQQRYDECLGVAQADGRDARAVGWNTRTNGMTMAKSIQGTVMENRVMEECRYRFDTNLKVCTSAQGKR